MKANIHPDYFETTITCSCGEVVQTRSTVKDQRVEICSKCHPFFTGKQKIIDTSGRVERFQTKYKNIPRRSSNPKKQAGNASAPAAAPAALPPASAEAKPAAGSTGSETAGSAAGQAENPVTTSETTQP